jgi:hypothetical protein
MRYSEIMTETIDPTQLAMKRIVIYPQDRLVYHTTNAAAADKIRQEGFRSGKELGINERRGAVYFSDQDVNPGLYARNDRLGEPYHGQATALIAVNLKGLRLLNMTETAEPNSKYSDPGAYPLHKAFDRFIKTGELAGIPLFADDKIDGTISYLKDGRIYEVCLPKKIANQALSSS